MTLMLTEQIESKVFLIRGQKVMLDCDLAKLYKVSTKRFNEQVKRNRKRFPGDFMFQLSKEEFEILRSQIATSRWGAEGTFHMLLRNKVLLCYLAFFRVKERYR